MSTATHTHHTPGPWTVDRWDHVKAPSGEDVLFTGLRMTCGNHPEEETAQANTRLAAAAPELLAALQKLEGDAINLHCALQSTAHMDPSDSRIPVITGGVVRDLLTMRDAARAAIAKAEGRA